MRSNYLSQACYKPRVVCGTVRAVYSGRAFGHDRWEEAATSVTYFCNKPLSHCAKENRVLVKPMAPIIIILFTIQHGSFNLVSIGVHGILLSGSCFHRRRLRPCRHRQGRFILDNNNNNKIISIRKSTLENRLPKHHRHQQCRRCYLSYVMATRCWEVCKKATELMNKWVLFQCRASNFNNNNWIVSRRLVENVSPPC